MKTYLASELKAIVVTFFIICLFVLSITAQSQKISTGSFDHLKIEGPVEVQINKTIEHSIVIENDGGLAVEEILIYSINGNELEIKSTGKVKDLKLIVNYENLNSLEVKGVANVISQNTITGETLSITSDGATDLSLTVDVLQLQIDASAATTVRLKGHSDNVVVKSSGAADVKAFDLTVKSANIESSGASDVKMDVLDNVTVKASGASNVKFKEEPQEKSIEVKGVADITYGGVALKGTDNQLFPDQSSPEKRKFDGHWSGVEIGFNAMVDPQLNSGFSGEFDFLELNYPKSVTVQLNFFEYNVPIVKNNLGLVTGLGLWINNYRFSDNIVLVSDSVRIYGFADTLRNYTKSKLTATYLTLPLIIEYQCLDKKDREIFHIGFGGYGSVKIGSKTKNVYIVNDQKVKIKDHGDFKINLFKYGLTARLGWRQVNFFANYNLSTLFEKNKGPETYPFEFGITLAGW